MEKSQKIKSGFAVLVGRSNVGKSTLLNALVGTKIAITTPKPQTTRRPLQGVVSNELGQIIFVDTPGVFQQSRNLLTKKLSHYLEESLRDIDVIVYVVDPTRQVGAEERTVLDLLRKYQVPKIFVINKMDKQKKPYLDSYKRLGEDFDTILEVSAKTHGNINHLIEKIFDVLPEGEYFYPKGQWTNLSNEKWLGELIREKLFLRLRQEVPYSVQVEVEEANKRENGTFYIQAKILTTEKRYQSMIIGKQGRGIKEIGQSARKELEIAMQCPVYLDLHVEVDPHWIERF